MTNFEPIIDQLIDAKQRGPNMEPMVGPTFEPLSDQFRTDY